MGGDIWIEKMRTGRIPITVTRVNKDSIQVTEKHHEHTPRDSSATGSRWRPASVQERRCWAEELMEHSNYLHLPTSRRTITALIGILAGGNVLMLGITYLSHTVLLPLAWRIRFVGNQFSLSRENNLAAWYSSMLLLSVSLAMFGCFALDMRSIRSRSERLLGYGWLAGVGPAARPPALILLEEGAEIFGALCFLASAIVFGTGWSHRDIQGSRLPEIVFRVRLGLVATAVIVLGTGLLLVHFGLPQPRWGGVTNWFPAALVAVVGLLSFQLASGPPRDRVILATTALSLLGLVNFALSIDHGSAHRFTEEVWSGDPVKRRILDAFLVSGILLSAVLFWLQARSRGAKGAVMAWALLLLVAFLDAGPPRALLAFAAYAILLPALVTTLPDFGSARAVPAASR